MDTKETERSNQRENRTLEAEELNLPSKSKKVKTNICNKKSKEITEVNEEQMEVVDKTDQPQIEVLTKKKNKKNKKNPSINQSISMKTSFNKFDALQKQNQCHNLKESEKSDCRICLKPVYKMEEIKAVKSVFHKNCFRCIECNKILTVDTYQSNEGIIYCIVHFKQIFGPRAIENITTEKLSKPQLIVSENQPLELPPDVVRASDKPDLGLAELQQLNVRERFHIFENPKNSIEKPENNSTPERITKNSSNKILEKVSKYQSVLNEQLNQGQNSTKNAIGNEDNVENDDYLLNLTENEHISGFSNAMQDIRDKFEKGQLMTKEERREERKQEIQNIRSRLFIGKQARIKEMYQHAIAETEQAITSAGKVEKIERNIDPRDIREIFEKGQAFKEKSPVNDEGSVRYDEDVFQSALSKESRSIFKALDSAASQIEVKKLNKTGHNAQVNSVKSETMDKLNENSIEDNNAEIVKSDEKAEDVQINTSDISSKFKFFETYQPTVYEKKIFRITPPRENINEIAKESMDKVENENLCTSENLYTKAMALNKFRELENNKNKIDNIQPKPLKKFTPPPDDNRRLIVCDETDYSSQEESDVEICEEDDDQLSKKPFLNDAAFIEAQAAARAKVLKAKFEKWETHAKEREYTPQIDVYAQNVSDDTNIESTKTIRERFEEMKMQQKNYLPSRQIHEVKRFI